MIISNVNRSELQQALDEVNKYYDKNVMWNNLVQMSGSGRRWRVTLKVKDSHGKGAKISKYYYPEPDFNHPKLHQRHIPSACWHVHGRFFDNLPDAARIWSKGASFRPHHYWEDFNVGSVMYPVYASECCDCGED